MGKLNELKVLIRGAGEMASGVAVRLFRSHFHVALTEIETPLCVRRGVSFCEALFEGRAEVEGCPTLRAETPEEVLDNWTRGLMSVLVDPDLASRARLRPDVLVDAVLAKKNLGTSLDQAELVVALGPGFVAGRDAHLVVETNRGHNLGRLIEAGRAEPDTGVPGEVGGETLRRVLRASAEGAFLSELEIGARVEAGQVVGEVAGQPVRAELAGVLRGLIRPGTRVWPGLKVGDIDPRGRPEYCWSVSEKARALGGSVLEAVLRHFNR